MSSTKPPFQTSVPLSWTQKWPDFHHSMVTCLAFSLDGRLLATGDLDGIVFIFDVSQNEPVLCLHLDPAVSATSLLWTQNSTFWLGASDGSLTCWRVNSSSAELKLLDLLPHYLPASPHALSLYPEDNPEYLIVAHCSTAEVWQRQGPTEGSTHNSWKGRGHLTSKDETDRVIACWPVCGDTAIVVFHAQGIRLWDFREDAQNVITNWPALTKVHSAHLMLTHPIGVGEDASILGQVIVISDTAVLQFELSLLPVAHLQILQQFPLMPDMVALSTASLWSMSPILITPSSDGLIAVDLKYHRYLSASGTIQARATQTIHQDDGTQHRRLASYSGKFGRHVASAFEGKQGWVVQLWTAADVCSRARLSGLGIEKRNGTPLVRWHEELPLFYAERKTPKSRRPTRVNRLLIMSASTLFFASVSLWLHWLRVNAVGQVSEWPSQKESRR